MIHLTSILSGFQAILGTSGVHFALLLCLVIFGRPPKQLNDEELEKHSREIFILMIVNHAFAAIVANWNGWLVWLSLCVNMDDKSRGDNLRRRIKRAKAYPVIIATIFHLIVIMKIVHYLIEHIRESERKDNNVPLQYLRFIITLQCEILAVFGNIIIKMCYLLFRTCFRFNKSDESYLALFNIVSGNPVSKKRVGHDNIDDAEDLLWYVIKISKICDSSAVPMVIYSYLTYFKFHGPSASIAQKIISGWLLPASVIQTSVGLLVAFKETMFTELMVVFGFLFLPVAILVATLAYSFVKPVQESLYQVPIWLSFFLQITNWDWFLVFWLKRQVRDDELKVFNARKIVNGRTWEEMKTEYGKQIEAWVTDYHWYVLLNRTEFEYCFDNNWK